MRERGAARATLLDIPRDSPLTQRTLGTNDAKLEFWDEPKFREDYTKLLEAVVAMRPGADLGTSSLREHLEAGTPLTYDLVGLDDAAPCSVGGGAIAARAAAKR